MCENYEIASKMSRTDSAHDTAQSCFLLTERTEVLEELKEHDMMGLMMFAEACPLPITRHIVRKHMVIPDKVKIVNHKKINTFVPCDVVLKDPLVTAISIDVSAPLHNMIVPKDALSFACLMGARRVAECIWEVFFYEDMDCSNKYISSALALMALYHTDMTEQQGNLCMEIFRWMAGKVTDTHEYEFICAMKTHSCLAYTIGKSDQVMSDAIVELCHGGLSPYDNLSYSLSIAMDELYKHRQPKYEDTYNRLWDMYAPAGRNKTTLSILDCNVLGLVFMIYGRDAFRERLERFEIKKSDIDDMLYFVSQIVYNKLDLDKIKEFDNIANSMCRRERNGRTHLIHMIIRNAEGAVSGSNERMAVLDHLVSKGGIACENAAWNTVRQLASEDDYDAIWHFFIDPPPHITRISNPSEFLTHDYTAQVALSYSKTLEEGVKFAIRVMDKIVADTRPIILSNKERAAIINNIISTTREPYTTMRLMCERESFEIRRELYECMLDHPAYKYPCHNYFYMVLDVLRDMCMPPGEKWTLDEEEQMARKYISEHESFVYMIAKIYVVYGKNITPKDESGMPNSELAELFLLRKHSVQWDYWMSSIPDDVLYLPYDAK